MNVIISDSVITVCTIHAKVIVTSRARGMYGIYCIEARGLSRKPACLHALCRLPVDMRGYDY